MRLTSLALLDGGRVAVVAVRTAAGARTASVLLVTPRQPEPSVLVASVPSPRAFAYNPTISSFGHGVAFRRRIGSERGLADQIVVIDVLRSTSRVVASARLRAARLSDPSLGFGRVVWSEAQIAGTRLVRSRVLVDAGVTDDRALVCALQPRGGARPDRLRAARGRRRRDRRGVRGLRAARAGVALLSRA